MKLKVTSGGAVALIISGPTPEWLLNERYNLIFDYRAGYGDVTYHYPRVHPSYEYRIKQLKEVIELCEAHDVEIDKSVYQRLKEYVEWHERELALAKEHKAALEEKAKQEKWQGLCSHGCGRCEFLKRVDADYVCAYSEELLDSKLESGYIRGKHYMFIEVAYPNERCLYKI